VAVLLSQLRGQDLVRDVLVRALRSGRVPHAYLFAGPPGVGKRTAAVALALALACPTGSAEGLGCGTCETCRRIEGGLHPDVLTFAPEGPWLLVEQAQAIIAVARSGPHEARARVIVLEDAERMNPNAANALLKTLEEPAPRTHLVLLTTAPDRVLPTINSRTQRLRFKKLAHSILMELARARGVAAGPSAVAATLADGSAAALFGLLEGDQQATLEEAVMKLRQAARGRGASVIFEAAAGVADKENKDALPAVLTLLQRVYRDGLARATGAPELALLAAGRAAQDGGARTGQDRDEDSGQEAERRTLASSGLAAQVPDNLPVPALLRALTASLEAEAALLGNVNPVFAFERLLIQLRRQEKWERA
jgi:DNA polymerase-3 subunit delta'